MELGNTVIIKEDFNYSNWWQLLVNRLHINRSYLIFVFLLGFYSCIPSVLSFIGGASIINSLNFTLYTIIYHGLNGFLFLSLLKQDFPESIKIPAILISGMSVNILTFLVLSFFHWQEYSFLNIFLLLSITIFSKSTLIKFQQRSIKTIASDVLVFMIILSAFTYFSNVFVSISSITNQHSLFQGAIACKLMYLSYPYTWHVFPEVPLYYHYGYHLGMASCASTTSISLELLSTNLFPTYSLYLLLLLTYSFCKEYFQGKLVVGALTILCVVFASQKGQTIFLNMMLSSMSSLPSVAIGFLVFFILICRINTMLEKNDFSYSNYIFIFLLSFVGAISRSSFSLVLAGGMSLFIATEFFKTLKITPYLLKLCILNFLVGASFLLSLFWVYGMSTPSSALGFIKFVPQNTLFPYSEIPQWLRSFSPTFFSVHPDYFSRLTALIHVIMLPGYLIFGFYYQIFKWIKNGIGTFELILLYCGLCGLVIWNFTESPGSSHYPFLYYAIFIFGIFGANGTYLIFTEVFQKRSISLLILSTLSLSMFYIRLEQLSFSPRWVDDAVSRFINYKPSTLTYSSWPDEFLEKISSLTQDNKNLIFVSLIDKKHDISHKSMQDFHALSIKSKGAELYAIEGITYIYNQIIRSNFEKRLSDLRISLRPENNMVLDAGTIKRFQSLFPGKDIIFIAEETKRIDPTQFQLLDNVSGIQILRVASSHK